MLDSPSTMLDDRRGRVADRIPASLLKCRERPALGPVNRQSDVARYLVDLDMAGADCRRKIEAINQIVRADEQPGERP